MPVLVLMDRTEQYVDDKQAQAITEAIEHKEDFITLNGYPLKLTAVMRIKGWGLAEPDVLEDRRLQEPAGTPATPSSPGYKKFLAQKRRLQRKLSLK